MSHRMGMTIVASALALSACGGEVGAGGSAVRVMREGRPSEEFRSVHLACTVMRPDPSSDYAALDCVFGDPDPSLGGTGLQVVAFFQGSLDALPAGTTLEQGTDFQVTSILGGTSGSFWGAGGDASWWEGDLTIVLDEPSEDGRAAVFDGTMRTTDVAAATMLTPITLDFDVVSATVR